MAERLAIDIFCGAGGLSEGFAQAGFEVLAGNDIDETAGATFQATHKNATFIPGPIQEIASDELLRKAGISVGELDVLLGGPPCQAYSVYNHQRGLHDERASLFKDYLRFVKEIQPKWVVMENVTGIFSIADGAVVKEICRELGKLGYDNIEAKILRSEDFGVPQERRRVFFIGNRIGVPVLFPEHSHGEGLKPFTTVWDAIGDLPALQNGESGDDGFYTCKPSCEFQRYARGNQTIVKNHEAPRLAEINMKRMRHIPSGGSWRDIPVDLLPEGLKRANRSDHTKRYGRLRPKGLASTILTKCDVHWGAFIHPVDNRAITVREAARLQSFPDFFEFSGPRTEQYVQVGNAVPPLLGKSVGLAIRIAEDSAQYCRSASAA